MRPLAFFVAVAVVTHGLTGCAQIAAQEAIKQAKACFEDAKSSPEGQMVYTRLWAFNDTDTAAKLSDPAPLTKDQQNALVQLHNKTLPCRQIIIAHDNRFAAWEAPYWQEFFARSDQLFYKLASGELPVGIANKLAIESNGQFQADVSRGHADAVRVEEAQRQQMAQTLIQANAQIVASQPRMTTTNCIWLANTLNCTGMR
jgi:hypothetical protein